MTELKKINVMLNELVQIRNECLPDSKEATMEQEMKNLDAFSRKKIELNKILRSLTEDVKRLNDLRGAAPDGRDATTIKLYSENSIKLKAAGDLWKGMKEVLIVDEKKKKLTEADMHDRKKMMNILASEIQELVNKNAHVKAVKETDEAKTLRTRREEQRKARREKRQKKKRGAAEDGTDDGGGNGDKNSTLADDIPDDDVGQPGSAPPTEAETQFFAQVEQERVRQDEMLDEIMKGMDELKVIAEDMNTSIKATSQLADEVGQSMGKVIDKFKSSNQRLKEILEESGGLSRWCPMLICVILLVALVGYMFNMLKGGSSGG